MAQFKTIILKQRPCNYCGNPAKAGRIWCRPCLARIRYFGCVDIEEFPNEEDSRRCGVPGPVDVF
jgi:hypothetical protein